MNLSRIPLTALLLLPMIGNLRAADVQSLEKPAPPPRPNFLFILTDDQGWADAKFAGHPYVKTPHLDAFAAQSTWLRQFYVAATVCSPSRCAFMTSHYPARHEIHGHFSAHEDNKARSMPDWLDPKTPTVASLLKQNGYATAHVGKWHLGGGPDAPTPAAYGFDFVRHTTGNQNYWDEGGNSDTYFRARSTALFVDETIKFIRENASTGSAQGSARPFYANLWTLLPHAPLHPTPEQLKVYENLAPRADDPAFGPWMQKYLANAKDLDSQMKVFCASLTDLDTQLGRLFAVLDELGLASNTVVFYSSDNGAEDYRIGNAANAGVGNTGPLRARKRSMYEGGVRTFGLVRWPGHVTAGRRDETSVMGGVDWLPTVCQLAGVALPADLKPDGEDVSDIWLGASRPRRNPLHWEWLFRVQGEDYTPPMLAIREGDWKLFVNHNGKNAQLFDITRDISETHDVAADHPELVKNLTEKALAWSMSLPPSAARDRVISTGSAVDAPRKKPAADEKQFRERAEMFKQKDANHDGTMSLEEYLHRFPDEAEGRRRFPTFDADKNGVLSEREFVTMGQL